MMANEPGGIVFAQSMGTLPAGALFPKEFRQGFFGRFDRGFGLLVLFCMIVTFVTVGLLSLRKPSETVSEKEIMRIQERYARLVLNQPKPAVEPKPAEVTEQITDKKGEMKKKKKEDVKIDREKETFIEKKRRRESGSEVRRQAREQAARQIQAAGIFAAITASGSGSGSMSSASDLLGTAGLGVTDLGALSLTRGTFTAKNVDPAELIARKESRTAGVDIERETVGRTAVTRVAANVEVNITTAPPEVTGESASLQERSQSAIQTIVSRESRRLKRLYEEWLKRDPTLGGRLTVKFIILPSGDVANVVVMKSTTGNSEFDEMVVRYIKRWRFSAIEGAGPVEVVYPFVFEGQS
ncbi:MAG: TonB family protein [Chitinispirillaceae bacterium]|nr:TonB family protein [Chitinispirillaceae bacterium]